MAPLRRFKIGQLVRNKVPSRIQKLGGRVEIHSLDSEAYLHHLRLKLREETEEVLAATTPKDIKEELADILEVLQALATSYGLQWEHVEKKRLQKQEERGGFKKAVFAEFVEVEAADDSHPVVKYCLSCSEKYPEIKNS